MKSRLLIGVVCEKVFAEQNSGIIKGIISQAFRSGCDIAVLSTLSDESSSNTETDIFKLLFSERFDGFLYLKNSFSSEQRCNDIEHLLLHTGKPVMMADGTEHNVFDSTISDDSRCFEKLTDHLIEVHGHRVIYCITGPRDDNSSEDRMNGFRNSMNQHGLYYDRNYCIYSDNTRSSAADTARYIAKGKLTRPDAVVCTDDRIAAAFINELCRLGIKVPDDIAVAGFGHSDDNPVFSKITSYKRDLFQLGTESLRKLYRIMTGNITPRTNNISEGLHIGVSCGCRPFSENSFSFDRRKLISDRFCETLANSRTSISCTDEISLEDALRRYCSDAFYIYRYHTIDICLSSDYIDAVENTSQNDIHIDADSTMIRYISSCSDGKITADKLKFKASDIAPQLGCGERRPMAVFVNLLRNSHSGFGYAVLSFGKEYQTYSKGYASFITGLDTVLYTFLKRSYSAFGSSATYTTSSSQFPLLFAIEKHYSNSTSTVITIEIQNIRRFFVSAESSEYTTAVTSFENLLKDCLHDGEKAAFVTNGTYAVITDRISGTEQIFKEMKSNAVGSLFGSDHKIVFSCYTSNNKNISLSEAVKLSLRNESSGYVIDGSITPNPLYEKLCMIRERMRLSPQLNWSIESISNELGISKSYLQKYYRNNFGASLIDSLIHIRMDMAKKLLRETDLTVTAIAEKCGYSSYIHFTKQFRKTESVTPTSYRISSRTDIDS